MTNPDTIQSRDFLIRKGDISIRPLQDRAADYSILFTWLQNPKVLEYYGGRDQAFTLALVQERYAPQVMVKAGKVPCLIEFLQRPVGYLQFCALRPDEYLEYGYSQNETIYGLDLFIGETALWGCGLGRRAICCTLIYLFNEFGATRVVLDPHADNLRAIHSYTAAGFRKIKLLPRHECHEGHLVDCWLMEATPEQVGDSCQRNEIN